VHVHVKVFAGFCARRRDEKATEAIGLVLDNLNYEFESVVWLGDLVLVAN